MVSDSRTQMIPGRVCFYLQENVNHHLSGAADHELRPYNVHLDSEMEMEPPLKRNLDQRCTNILLGNDRIAKSQSPMNGLRELNFNHLSDNARMAPEEVHSSIMTAFTVHR